MNGLKNMRAKLIKEYNFQRGLDPKVAMDTGEGSITLNVRLNILPNKRYKWIIDPIDDSAFVEFLSQREISYQILDPGKNFDEIGRAKESNIGHHCIVKFFGTKKALYELLIEFDVNPWDAKEQLNIKESINFERNLDPKKAMRTDFREYTFKTINELVDYVIVMLPKIFGGKIPKDILSYNEWGTIPQHYYNIICEYLSQYDHKVPGPENTTKLVNPFDNYIDAEKIHPEFQFWPSPVRERLIAMGFDPKIKANSFGNPEYKNK